MAGNQTNSVSSVSLILKRLRQEDFAVLGQFCAKITSTVEPRFNEPLYNEVLGITRIILQPGQSYSKMYGTEPRYNEPRLDY